MADNDAGYGSGASEVWADEEDTDDYVRSIYESLRKQSTYSAQGKNDSSPILLCCIRRLALFLVPISVALDVSLIRSLVMSLRIIRCVQ